MRDTVRVQARSALFDVYGDHLRRRGGAAPVAALIRLLGALDIAAPAVRTAVSRMVRQDWLEPVPTGDGPGYALTERAVRRLDDAYARIYRTQPVQWDGRWHVVVTERPDGRSARERLASGLTFLGYGPLGGGTWVAPRAHPEVPAVLAAEGVRAEAFHAAYDGAGGALAGAGLGPGRGRGGVRAVRAGRGAAAPGRLRRPRPGPGGVRDPLAAGPRVAPVPVPGPGAAGRGPAARLAGCAGRAPVRRGRRAAGAGGRPLR